MSNFTTCQECGTHIEDHAGACQKCGRACTGSISSVPPPPTPIFQSNVEQPYIALQRAIVYQAIAQLQRRIGIGFLLIAGILLTLPLSYFSLYDAAVIIMFLILLGVVAVGIRLIVSPTAAGLLLAACIMFVTAVCAVLLAETIYLLPALIVVPSLFFYGISLIRRYQRYGRCMADLPPQPLQRQANALLHQLSKAQCKDLPELIEFKSEDPLVRVHWRGLLQDDLVVLVGFEGRSVGDVYFLSPSELTIDSSGDEYRGKWLKAQFVLKDRKFTGTIPPECYKRYEAWIRKYLLPVS